MESELYTIKELFDNSSFKAFAPLFIDKSITVSEAANRSGISRQTIIHLMKSAESYVVAPDWSSTVKGRPIHLDSKILTEYLAIELGLDIKERMLLDEIMHNPLVNPIITKNNDDIDMCVSKVVLTILLIGSGFYSDDLPKSKPFTPDLLFGVFLTNNSAVQKQNRYKAKPSTNKSKPVKATIMHNSFDVSEQEFEDWKLELHRYAKSLDNDTNFWNLLIKVRDLKKPIITYPRQWYDLFNVAIPALLGYSVQSTAKQSTAKAKHKNR